MLLTYIPSSTDNAHKSYQMIGQWEGRKITYSRVFINMMGIYDFWSLVLNLPVYSEGADFLMYFSR